MFNDYFFRAGKTTLNLFKSIIKIMMTDENVMRMTDENVGRLYVGSASFQLQSR